MIRVRSRLLALGAALAWSGCSDLPNLRADECGNGVIDTPREDCDTFPQSGDTACRPKGAVGECHYDCSMKSDGRRQACPLDWGCDRDDVCREPSGNFAAPERHRVGGIESLLAADFDGDGRSEMISRDGPNMLGESHLSVHYFAPSSAGVETRTFGSKVAALGLAQLPVEGAPRALSEQPKTRTHLAFTRIELTNDRQAGMVFARMGVGLLFGQSDRSLVPETISPYPIPGSSLRLVSLHSGPIDGQFAMVVLTQYAGQLGVHVVDGRTLTLVRKGELFGPVDQLAGEPVSAQIDAREGSPCRELVHAFSGAEVLHVSDLCEPGAQREAPTWRPLAVQSTVALVPPAPITGGPRIDDVDRDGHLDVMVGTAHGPYLARGDGRGLAAATPYGLPLASPDPLTSALPLAMRDFTGDGEVDFVLPDRLLVSRKLAGSALPRYEVGHRNTNAPWSAAAVADLNGDGKLDVVAASRAASGLDFFGGTATATLIPLEIATAGPVAHLASGDFDGDALSDLVLVEKALDAAGEDTVRIAYGAPYQAPRAPVVAARVRAVEHLALHEGGSLLTHIAVVSRGSANGGVQGISTWLFGSPGRAPVTTYDLASFVESGSLRNHRALALATGRFAETRGDDAIALALDPSGAQASAWLLAGFAGAREPPRRLDGMIDPRLSPAAPLANGLVRAHVASAAADFDGDARDEVVWVMPADQGQRCGIVVASVDPVTRATLAIRSTLVLETSCRDPDVVAVDADGDERPDLALLTGTRGADDRQLIVLWTDAAGTLAPANLTVVSAAGESPKSFTAIAPSQTLPFRFAYVAGNALMIARREGPRGFALPVPIAPLERATGVAAADVTGDGLVDVVVAESGDLTVFPADWRRP